MCHFLELPVVILHSWPQIAVGGLCSVIRSNTAQTLPHCIAGPKLQAGFGVLYNPPNQHHICIAGSKVARGLGSVIQGSTAPKASSHCTADPQLHAGFGVSFAHNTTILHCWPKVREELCRVIQSSTAPQISTILHCWPQVKGKLWSAIQSSTAP